MYLILITSDKYQAKSSLKIEFFQGKIVFALHNYYKQKYENAMSVRVVNNENVNIKNNFILVEKKLQIKLLELATRLFTHQDVSSPCCDCSPRCSDTRRRAETD